MTRTLLSAALLAYALVANVQQGGLVPPEVAVQEGDFAAARAAFHTKLVRKGPAPPKATMPSAPEGVEVVSFPSGELHLSAWLQRPAGESGKAPALVFLHGGFAFGLDDWKMTVPLREAGYVVLAPMLRGENGQSGVYTLFYDEVDDVLAAGRFLAAQPFVDAKRVYVAGHSVGGTLALLAALSSKDFRAAASFSGSPDQVIYCRIGIPAEQIPFDVADPHEFELRSPLAYAYSFKCPVRLFFGSEEPHFRLSTERTAELARAAGLDVQAVQVEGDHFSALPAELEQALVFFEEH
ncbi:MAG: alpha/beta fold hydrolase [Planctomycetes bacterium]|nr:alpha/beta fold hydrolase [Planctomycetota bacterium]